MSLQPTTAYEERLRGEGDSLRRWSEHRLYFRFWLMPKSDLTLSTPKSAVEVLESTPVSANEVLVSSPAFIDAARFAKQGP